MRHSPADNVANFEDYLDEAWRAVGQGETEKKPPELLTLIDPAHWQGQDAPERRWKVKDLVPDGQATLLTGAGAAGKSLTMQLQCTCIAAGIPFLGIEVEQAVALYITCEDDAEELHRRQVAICDSLGITLDSLSGKLFLLSLAGEIGNELATFDREGRMAIAPRYEQIEATALAVSAGYVTLDNTAHFFSGNENDRHQVGSFVGLCNRLAITISGAVVIVGHPNKAGDSYSGSTAWENQVRSRLFLERHKDAEGNVTDPDKRVLRNEKANYSQHGKELEFVWFKGCFVLPEALPEDDRKEMAEDAQAAIENERFLACLAVATTQGRGVSHQKGTNWACSTFARMPQANGIAAKQFEKALERLLALGTIRLNQPLWQDAHRHWKYGIKLSSECGDPPQEMAENRAATPAATPCGDLREPHSQVIENTCGVMRAATPPSTTYLDGGPAEGRPPSFPYGDPNDNPLLRRDR